MHITITYQIAVLSFLACVLAACLFSSKLNVSIAVLVAIIALLLVVARL